MRSSKLKEKEYEETLLKGYIGIVENLNLGMKGGNTMETKSRYEVIAESEAQKRNLIREREGFDNLLIEKKKELKELQRDIDDKKEEIKDFEDSLEKSKETITELIASVDDSLKRFSGLGKKS